MSFNECEVGAHGSCLHHRRPAGYCLDALRAELQVMRERKDAAYLERNQVVAALAGAAIQLGGCAGIARTAIEGWSDDWHGCVYIELPGAGQVSWHFHDSHAGLFDGLPTYGMPWDGHSTPEKYRRVDRFARCARGVGP